MESVNNNGTRRKYQSMKDVLGIHIPQNGNTTKREYKRKPREMIKAKSLPDVRKFDAYSCVHFLPMKL